jgi:hypothetical protein
MTPLVAVNASTEAIYFVKTIYFKLEARDSLETSTTILEGT